MVLLKRNVKSKKGFSNAQVYLMAAGIVAAIIAIPVSLQQQESRSRADYNYGGGDYDSHDHYSYPTMPMHTPMPGDVSVDTLKYVPAGEPLKSFTLTTQVNAAGQWTYNGTVPGPQLRATQGDHVRVTLNNRLPESTTIHWHGINIVGSQDGAAGVTQNAVQPNKTYIYDFVVKDPGTFWYHSHQNTSKQVPKGLFGALIVDPKQPTTTYARDYTIGFNDLSLGSTQLAALSGERVRLRFINMRIGGWDGTPLKVGVLGAPFKLIAFDGQNINAPQLLTSKVISLGMGQRADVEITVPPGGVDVVQSPGGYSGYGGYSYSGSTTRTIHVGPGLVRYSQSSLTSLPGIDLTAYGTVTLDSLMPKTTFDKEYTLTLGSDMTINGKRAPYIPDIRVKKGDLIKITYVNNSDKSHPMHMHGHAYSLLKMNGKAVTGSPIHMDAITLKPHETAEVAVLANNPGVWMIHCHILDHAAKGMTMMLMYDGVYTPYQVGGSSGNHPE